MRSISADAVRLRVRLSGSTEEDKSGVLALVHVIDAPLSSVEGPLKEEGELLKSATSTGLNNWHPFSKVGCYIQIIQFLVLVENTQEVFLHCLSVLSSARVPTRQATIEEQGLVY